MPTDPGDRAQRLSALKALRQVVHPTSDVTGAVQAVAMDGEAALARAAGETIRASVAQGQTG